MKLMAITIAILGLTVTANKTFAQNVRINLQLGDVRVHYNNGYNCYERDSRFRERRVVYVRPEHYRRYDRGMRDNCSNDNRGYNNSYSYNDRYNDRYNNRYDRGYGRR